MSQALPALPVISYDLAPNRQPISPARVAGWCGFVAVVIGGLYGPMFAQGIWIQGHMVDPSTEYEHICKTILPVAQAFLSGIAGVLLFIARRNERTGYRAGWVFAFTLAILSIGLVSAELTHNLRDLHQNSLVRWTSFSTTF